jgi:uridine phosphorylase
MRKIGPSELILNPDGSIYHLNLKPEHVAPQVIFVGDQDRVDKVAKNFDHIEFRTQKREFKTVVGSYRNKRFTVISTGIGPDNIDIVLNEIDALVNIDLITRTLKTDHTSLQIIRIGTSGSLQQDIPVDSIVLGKYGLGFDGLLHYYQARHIMETEIEEAFIAHCSYPAERSRPYVIKGSELLKRKLFSDEIFGGITATAIGFYGPQGRVLRLPVQDEEMNHKIESFRFDKQRVTNFEMETSAIYGLSTLMGHEALSMNVIIANRPNLTYSKDPDAAIEKLIQYTLNKLSE